MKKRLLTFGLASLLFVGALTGIFVGISANTETEFDPDNFNYEELYVDGAVLHYSAMDRKKGDTVDPILATSENGKQLVLSQLGSSTTKWTYGDGYLEISTGSVLQAKDIFAPGDELSHKKLTFMPRCLYSIGVDFFCDIC